MPDFMEIVKEREKNENKIPLEKQKCTKNSKCYWSDYMSRHNDQSNVTGLYVEQYINIKDGRKTKKLIQYKYKKDGKQKNVILNFCPNCGVSQIDFLDNEKKIDEA